MPLLNIGTKVRWKDKTWEVEEFVGVSTVRLRRTDGSLVRIAGVAELQSEVLSPDRLPIQLISEDQWARANEIFAALQPLLGTNRRKRQDIIDAAAKLDCSEPAIYKYLHTWNQYRRISAFVRKSRSDKGKSRMDPKVQEVIDKYVETHYKTEERPDIAETLVHIRAECSKLGLMLPSMTPLLNAIKLLPEKERIKGRYGKKMARERYTPYRGSFPGAEYPLSVFQIDHTPADVILVDEEFRKPIGRATLTIVIDVCTRMLAGFCITLEAPGALNAALALSHAILPKGEWLKNHVIEEDWPIWGLPTKVHADNAKEFRGTALHRGCAEYGITLENRPKGQPQYGGHVERSFRTFMRATQRLKGTTFSSVAKKINYDSEGKAILTIAEYEHWFALYIVYRYHQKKQSGTGHPPINLYKRLLLGSDTLPPIGSPAPIDDPKRLLIDFMPFIMRSVQQDGVSFGLVQYWEDVLRKWLKARDAEDPSKPKQFVFAYDPRDMSVLYFLDPDNHQYYPIPYRNKGRPPVSLWELRASKRWLAEDPLRQTNEEMIFLGVEKMREVETDSAEKTKKVRRQRARRKGWETAQSNAAKQNAKKSLPPPSKVVLKTDDDLDDIVIPTFDDI